MADIQKAFFLKPCPELWRDGYIIPVRNRMNNILQNEFLPAELKSAFVAQWGERIIYDDDFIDWYCQVRKEQN